MQPVGHARRREEAVPLIASKLQRHLQGFYDAGEQERILSLLTDHDRLVGMTVNDFIDVRTRVHRAQLTMQLWAKP